MSTKIEVINQDVTTKEGWEEYVKSVRDSFHRRASKKEIQIADVTLLVKRHPDTGEPLPMPMSMMLVTVFQGDKNEAEIQKDRFAHLCRSLALVGDAVASIFCSETWIVVTKDLNLQARPSEHPERRDALAVWADHRDFGAEGFCAYVTPRPRSPKRDVAPWILQGVAKGPARFTGFVPTAEQAQRADLLAVARAYIDLEIQDGSMERYYPQGRARG